MPPIAANRLARICAYSANAPEWEQFVRLVTPVVALSARRVSALWGESSGSTVSEIVQEVFVKLCEDDRRILREFDDRGNDSFLKLLRMITASVGTDYFRRSRAEKRGGRVTTIHIKASIADNEISDIRDQNAVQSATLMAQLDGLLRKYPQSVSPRDRNLFWLYYRQGMTADAISRIPAIGLSAKGVESALGRLTRLLREAITSGKSVEDPVPKDLPPSQSEKGFSSVVAINNVKRR